MSTEELTDVELPSDQEIFNKASSKEPIADTPTEETPAEASDDRPRDERGRFKPKDEGGDENPPAVAEATPPIVETPKDEKPDHIPSWRLKEEADARREATERARRLEEMVAQYERRIQELTPKPEPRPFPDFFADPESLQTYFQTMLAEERANWQKEHRATVANVSFQRAHDKHGDMFNTAYEAVLNLPFDAPERQAVINSPDPGQTMINWYKREQTIAQVGDDPTAFIQKKLDEALDDPQFLAKALEKARGVASAQPNQKIEMPHSLNKVAASAPPSGGPQDMTDEAIFARAMRRG